MDCCHNCFAFLAGFLLFALVHMLIVTGCVSPSTSSWVANLAVYSGVGAWRMPSASLVNWHSLFDEDSVTHSVVLQNYQEDETMLGDTLENLGRRRNTGALCWPRRPARARTIKTKLSVSGRRLAASSRT